MCQNTLNLALRTAKRNWSTVHTVNVSERMQEAADTLFIAEKYMSELGKEIHELQKISLSERKVMDYINEFFPDDLTATDIQRKNVSVLREEMKRRYFDAPNLKGVVNNAYLFRKILRNANMACVPMYIKLS